MAKKKEKTVKEASEGMSKALLIRPVNMNVLELPIIGTAPYCQHNFSAKSRNLMLEKMTTVSKGKKTREPRNLDEEMEGAIHRSEEGWVGIPAASFRAAMISACRLINFKMTLAKLSVFVDADGLDAATSQPLVKLHAGEPERSEMAVRLESGVASVAIRPLWREWGAMVTVRWDGDQFCAEDVINLLDRAGQQVGIGEGRPDSRKSAGLGWGTFKIDEAAMKKGART